MPRGFQPMAWLVLLMYFGTVAEEARISGTDRVQAHVQGHTWPTGFCGVYEVDGTCSHVTVDLATTAVEVASKVACSGPNAAASKEIPNSSEARARPPPLQTSQDFKALVKGGGLNATRGVTNNVASSLESSTELKLCKWRKMLECPMDLTMDVVDSVLLLVLRPHVCRPVLLLALTCIHIVCVRVRACVCACVRACERTHTHTHTCIYTMWQRIFPSCYNCIAQCGPNSRIHLFDPATHLSFLKPKHGDA